MEYYVELTATEPEEWFVFVTIHGREFNFGPFRTEREAQLEVNNREADRVESWYPVKNSGID